MKFDAIKADMHSYIDELAEKQERFQKMLNNSSEHDERLEIQDTLNRIEDKINRLDKALDELEN